MAIKKPKPGESFGDKFPELASMWDQGKNGYLTPFDVTHGSHIEVYWIDSRCGHAYKRKVDTVRNSKGRCPVCAEAGISPRKVPFEKSLAAAVPGIESQWDYSKNLRVYSPDTIARQSNVKIWWICKNCGVSFSRSPGVVSRVRHPFICTICAGAGNKIPGASACSSSLPPECGIEESLGELHPEVLEIWDWDKNEVDPFKVREKSSFKVYLICPLCDKSISRTVFQTWRRRLMCRSCSARLARSPENSAMSKNPFAMLDWDYDKNYPLTPDDVNHGSEDVVWWVCHTCGTEWQAEITRVARGALHCPGCFETSFIERDVFEGLKRAYPQEEIVRHFRTKIKDFGKRGAGAEEGVAECDIAFMNHKLIIEYDGGRYHTVKTLPVDKRKTIGLLEKGFRVIRVRESRSPRLIIQSNDYVGLVVDNPTTDKVLNAVIPYVNAVIAIDGKVS